MNRIVHILVSSKFLDGMGYQENYLSRKHRQLGYDVSVLSFSEVEEKVDRSIDEVGIQIIRLPINNTIFRKIPIIRGLFHRVKGIYQELERITPDIIFVHGVGIADDMDVVKYKRHHKNVVVYADSHADYYNTPVNTIACKIATYTYGRYFAKRLSQICKKVWGVSPWRVEYLNNVYKIPNYKTGLLVMGGDEDKINDAVNNNSRKAICIKYGIPEDAFLIVSGGKMDVAKNIHLLVEAINKIHDRQTYLILFGKMNQECHELCLPYFSNRIIEVGWIAPNEVYPLFVASDLAVFPGTHSVLWEQSCASGIPAVFKGWNGGFNHLDVGGNCLFIENPTAENLYSTIISLVEDKEKYSQMLETAQDVAQKEFSYLEIAKKSIELIQ